tara:strand:- start:621 stop:1115 length:495 start_codon:yes stop_codon:yes gene_type:complete
MSSKTNNYSKKEISNMSNNILMMIDDAGEQSTRPASEIFKGSVGLTMHNDELCAVFSTVENRKGYGRQFVPVSELQATLEVLQGARDNGIVNEAEEKSTSEIVKSSLIESEDGEIRFKTEDSKGKKPTLCGDFDDFVGFVNAFESYVPKIISKAQAVQAKLQNK